MTAGIQFDMLLQTTTATTTTTAYEMEERQRNVPLIINSFAQDDVDDNSTIASFSDYSDDSSFFCQGLNDEHDDEGEVDVNEFSSFGEAQRKLGDEDDSYDEDSICSSFRRTGVRRIATRRDYEDEEYVEDDDDDSMILLRGRVTREQHASWSDQVLEMMNGDSIDVPLNDEYSNIRSNGKSLLKYARQPEDV